MANKTGFVSLIYQSEYIEYLKSKKYSYKTIHNWVQQARILARKGLLHLSETDLENVLWEKYSRASAHGYRSAYRNYWNFRNLVTV